MRLHPTGADGAAGSGLAWGAACWFLALAVWLTWNPFAFSLAPPSPPEPSTLADRAANLLLLMPLGLAVGFTGVSRPVRVALALGAAASLSIEAGQLFLPSRVPSTADVLLNAAGAAGAAWLARTTDAPRRAPWSLGALLALLYGVLVLTVGAAHQRLAREWRLEGWNPAYAIRAGDEIGADRRYRGAVDSASICAGRDQPVCARPGAAAELRRSLVERAESSQRVRARASVRPDSDTQTGPARIVTFSRGAYLRNLTVGQEGTELIVRVRTPLAGLNGTGLELAVPDAIRPGERTGVDVTLEALATRVALSSGADRRVASFRLDGLAAGLLWGGGTRVEPRQIFLLRSVTAVLLLFPLLMLGYALRRRRPSPLPPAAPSEHSPR